MTEEILTRELFSSDCLILRMYVSPLSLRSKEVRIMSMGFEEIRGYREEGVYEGKIPN